MSLLHASSKPEEEEEEEEEEEGGGGGGEEEEANTCLAELFFTRVQFEINDDFEPFDHDLIFIV
jgi:hypothetical protein